MKKLESIIRKNPIFKGMSKSHFEILCNGVKRVQFKEGKYIFHEGKSANKFYMVLSGNIALEVLMANDRDPIIINIVGKGNLLGWSWIFPPYRWRFDAHALTDVEAIQFDGMYIRKRCEEDNSLGYELMKRYALLLQERLDSLRSQNPDLYLIHN